MTTGSALRRHGTNHRSGSSLNYVPVTPISTTLINPVTLTTDTSTSAGLGITMGQFVPAGHHAFEIQNASGTVLLYQPPDNGLVAAPGYEIRAYHAKGDTNYATIFGPNSTDPPFVAIPDGQGGQLKMWGGVGAPVGSTVGTASVGDAYWRKRSASTQVLYRCSVAGAPGTWVQVI